MIFGRLLGWLLIISGLATAVRDLVEWLQTGALRFEAAGELWFRFDPISLNAAQAAIQRYTLPEIWDPGFVTILLLPAVIVLLIPGILLVALCRTKKRRTRLMG